MVDALKAIFASGAQDTGTMPMQDVSATQRAAAGDPILLVTEFAPDTRTPWERVFGSPRITVVHEHELPPEVTAVTDALGPASDAAESMVRTIKRNPITAAGVAGVATYVVMKWWRG